MTMTKDTLYKILLVLIFVPFLASACDAPSIPYWASGGLVSCTGLGCHDFCDLICTFVRVVYFGITIAVFAVAPVLFAVGGILILTSGGSPGRLEQGKKTLTGTLIGVLITLLAYLIVATFVKFLGASGIGGFSGSSCTIQ